MAIPQRPPAGLEYKTAALAAPAPAEPTPRGAAVVWEGIVAATGCNTVYTSTYPYNPYLVPWTNSLFENAPADAMGVRNTNVALFSIVLLLLLGWHSTSA